MSGPLLPPGAYWCAVVAYHDGSGILGVYGPYRSQETAEAASKRLQEAGVHEHQAWHIKPLWMMDLGAVTE